MYKDKSMTIRKNFLFDEDIVEHLEKIAKDADMTQTQVIKNMIEEKYEIISIKEKLEILHTLAGSSQGMYTSKSVQSIKAGIDV